MSSTLHMHSLYCCDTLVIRLIWRLNTMKFKDFLAGILTGIAAGIVVSEVIDRM